MSKIFQKHKKYSVIHYLRLNRVITLTRNALLKKTKQVHSINSKKAQKDLWRSKLLTQSKSCLQSWPSDKNSLFKQSQITENASWTHKSLKLAKLETSTHQILKSKRTAKNLTTCTLSKINLKLIICKITSQKDQIRN